MANMSPSVCFSTPRDVVALGSSSYLDLCVNTPVPVSSITFNSQANSNLLFTNAQLSEEGLFVNVPLDGGVSYAAISPPTGAIVAQDPCANVVGVGPIARFNFEADTLGRAQLGFDYVEASHFGDYPEGFISYNSLEGTLNTTGLEIFVARPGDVNLDGAVNLADVQTLASHYGRSGGWREGDLTGDGRVNLLDVGELARSQYLDLVGGHASAQTPDGNYIAIQQPLSISGRGYDPAGAVPEPTSALTTLVLLGAGLLSRFRNKREKTSKRNYRA